MKPIYHGTTKKDLSVIRPFKRFTPGGELMTDSIPPRVYATYHPAYAVAHSFAWSSDDGVDILVEGDTVTLVLPADKQTVLEQSVCVYVLSDDAFIHTIEEETGLTYHSVEEVVPIGCECFASVTAALHHFGGNIKCI